MAAKATAPERPIGKYERLGLERQARDHALGKARGLYFDEAAASRAVEFFERFCKHHKGEWAGQPFLLGPHQKNNLREIFGWKRADGFRRFRTVWWEEPRKNGKTQVAAGVGLYLFAADQEPGAEVYATATKRDQAMIAFSAAKAMVKSSADLRRFIRSQRSNLSCERLGSKFEPLSSDYNTLDGLNPHGDLRDEVHAWKDPLLAAVLDTAMGSRRQPLTFNITTAGTYDPQAVGWTQHDYACKVLEGVFEDDSLYVYIAAADEGDDPYAPETWAKANPNLGVSLKADYIAKQAEKAERQPSFTNEFLRLHLDRWTQQNTRWLSLERWNECDARPFAPGELDGRACFGGLDLAAKLDLTAFVLAFPRPDGTDLLARFWIPAGTVETEARKGRKHYAQWVKEGWLTETPGDVVDQAFIRAEVNDLAKKYQIQQIAYDPWNATAIATELHESDGFEMVECRQGYKTMSEPSKEFEARVVSRTIRHGGNPVLRWCVANCAIDTDPGGNIKPAKDKAVDKIDGVTASIMALSRTLVAVSDAYPERGFAGITSEEEVTAGPATTREQALAQIYQRGDE